MISTKDISLYFLCSDKFVSNIINDSNTRTHLLVVQCSEFYLTHEKAKNISYLKTEIQQKLCSILLTCVVSFS